METVTAESGAVTVGMEDVTAVENFIAGVCPYLLGASKDDITSALRTPDATFKLKKFASDPKNPVLFINLAAPDDEEVEEGTVSAGTPSPCTWRKKKYARPDAQNLPRNQERSQRFLSSWRFRS